MAYIHLFRITGSTRPASHYLPGPPAVAVEREPYAGDICDPPSGSERIKTGGYFSSMSMVLALFLLARMVLRIVPMFLPQLIGRPKSPPPLATPLWSGMLVSFSFRPRTAEVTRLFPDNFLHSPKGRFTQRSMRGQSV